VLFRPNTVTYNYLIEGYARVHELGEAEKILERMRAAGVSVLDHEDDA
jgi:pentatricopeptide repeat protein